MKNFATKTLAVLTTSVMALSCADDGENGLGFNDATKFGSIEITLEGTLPNDEAFNESNDFPLTFGNTVQQDVDEGTHEFLISRSSLDLISFVDIRFGVADIGEATEDITFFSLEIGDFQIISEEGKRFVFSDFSSINDINITDLTFDEATGELSFSFAFEVDGESNDTDNDLNISGTVDVIVLEDITPGGGFFR